MPELETSKLKAPAVKIPNCTQIEGSQMKIDQFKHLKIEDLEVGEAPAPLNIPTPTPAPDFFVSFGLFRRQLLVLFMIVYLSASDSYKFS